MEHIKIQVATAADFETLVRVWETSVRATHHFLTEKDIATFKPLILNVYLPALRVRKCVDAQDRILGFVSVGEDAGVGKVEMLFIAPQSRGLGVGKRLLCEAVNIMGATEVDVNEQNAQAVGFYKHMGFEQVGRSALDGQGNPFPLLHMQYKPRGRTH